MRHNDNNAGSYVGKENYMSADLDASAVKEEDIMRESLYDCCMR